MKKILPGLGVFIFLLAVDMALIVSSSQKTAPHQAPDNRIDFPETSVQKVEIHLPDGRISPRQNRMEELVQSFRNMTFEKILEARADNSDEFGLDEKSGIVLSVLFSDGNEMNITFGKKLTLDVLSVYASIEGRPGVYTVLASFKDRCVQAAAEARER